MSGTLSALNKKVSLYKKKGKALLRKNCRQCLLQDTFVTAIADLRKYIEYGNGCIPGDTKTYVRKEHGTTGWLVYGE